MKPGSLSLKRYMDYERMTERKPENNGKAQKVVCL